MLNRYFFAEFYAPDSTGKIAPALGDRSIIVLDGRESSRRHHAIAARECKVRGYVAYRLAHGRFSEPRYLSDLVKP